jgi:hypothetical protein
MSNSFPASCNEMAVREQDGQSEKLSPRLGFSYVGAMYQYNREEAQLGRGSGTETLDKSAKGLESHRT